MTRLRPRRPFLPLRLAALGALAALLAAATWTEIGARIPSPEDPDGDAARQRVSLERARHAGEAMTEWLRYADALAAASTTATASRGAAETRIETAIEAEVPPAAAGEPAAPDEPTTADWSRCPAVSHEELAAALVPDFLDELPRTDGWGHPLEFCLEPAGAATGTDEPRYRLGVRSPGRDGRFDSGDYAVGGFPPDSFDRDLLWLDGFLVTWPDPEPVGM